MLSGYIFNRGRIPVPELVRFGHINEPNFNTTLPSQCDCFAESTILARVDLKFLEAICKDIMGLRHENRTRFRWPRLEIASRSPTPTVDIAPHPIHASVGWNPSR